MTITPETIRMIRAVKRWSQRKLAQHIDCSYSLICRVENGERNVTKRIQQSIIEKLSLTEEALEWYRHLYHELNQIEAV